MDSAEDQKERVIGGASADQPSDVERVSVLGPGLHLGSIELQSDTTFGVRLLDGRRVRASLSPQVHLALVEECLREQRPMMLVDTSEGPSIVGALQVAPSIAPDIDGNLTIAAKSLRLEALEELRLEAGRSELRLEENGKAKIRAEKAVFDVASNLRIYSALVELP